MLWRRWVEGGNGVVMRVMKVVAVVAATATPTVAVMGW
jgi:hypothetical protein